MIYFISDTHFCHKGIMRYCPWRRAWPDVNSMNEGIISLWNHTIKPEDTVYFLGDFAMGKVSKVKKIIPQLNGHKIMVRGNHDLSGQFYRDVGFEDATDGPVNMLFVRPNLPNITILLNHFPYYPNIFKRMYYFLFDKSMLRELDRHPKNEGKLLIHGHVHGRWFVNGNMINAGLDANVKDGMPHILSYKDVIKIIDEKGIK